MPVARPAILFACTVVGLLTVSGSGMAARKSHRHGGLTRHARYAGTTSQRTDITLQLSNDAKRVTKLRIIYNVTCDNQTSVKTYTDILNSRIASGAFQAQGVYKGQRDGSTNSFQIKGSLTRTSAHGTFSLSATGKTNAGRELHCITGKLTWKARKA